MRDDDGHPVTRKASSALHDNSRGTYGWPSVHRALRREGVEFVVHAMAARPKFPR